MTERRYKITTICPHCQYEYELGDVKLHGTEKEEYKRPGLHNLAHEVKKEKPAPQATEQEWEEWVRKMPCLSLHLDPLRNITIKDYDKWVNWLLAIPCRKRREG